MTWAQPQQNFHISDEVAVQVAQEPTGTSNLIYNATFEDGAWGWTTGSQIGGYSLLTPHYNGRYVLNISQVEAIPDFQLVAPKAFPVEAGKTYVGRWSVDGTSDAQQTNVGTSGVLLDFYDDDDNLTGQVFPAVSTPPVSWHTVEVVYMGGVEAPAGSTQCVMTFFIDLPAPSVGNTTDYYLYEPMICDDSGLPSTEVVESKLIDPLFEGIADEYWLGNSFTTLSATTATTTPEMPGVAYPILRGQAPDNLALAASAFIDPSPSPTPDGVYARMSTRMPNAAPGCAHEQWIYWYDGADKEIFKQRINRGSYSGTTWATKEAYTAWYPGAAKFRLVWRSTAGHTYDWTQPMVTFTDYRTRPWFDGDNPPDWAAESHWSTFGTVTHGFQSASGTVGEFPFQDPTTWVDIDEDIVSGSIERSGLDVGKLELQLLGDTTDPAQSPVLASGRPIRVLVGDVQTPVFVGRVENVISSYRIQEKVPGRRVSTSLSAYDGVGMLAGTDLSSGATNEGAMRLALGAHTPIPYSVNLETGHLSDDATEPRAWSGEWSPCLDVVTRFVNTVGWGARVDREGVLDMRPMYAYGSYGLDGGDVSNIEVALDTSLVFNKLTIKTSRTTADGEIEEWEYGPYTDRDSVRRHGERNAELAVASDPGAVVTRATWEPLATAWLTENATQVPRVRSFERVIRTPAELVEACTMDILDVVNITDVDLDTDASQALRISTVKHEFSLAGWHTFIETAASGTGASSSTPTTAQAVGNAVEANAPVGVKRKWAAISSSGTITSGSWVTLGGYDTPFPGWDASDIVRPPDGGWTYSSGTIAATRDLWITVTLYVEMANNTSGRRGVRISTDADDNGMPGGIAGQFQSALSASPHRAQAVYDGPLKAGHSLFLQAYQDSGSTLACQRQLTISSEIIG